MSKLVESYINKTENDGVIFCFRGPMTLGLLESLEGSLTTTVGQQNEDVNTVFKVFSIFVEQVQNVLRYSADKLPSQEPDGEALGAGVVIIGRKEDRFFVSCGNIIKNSDVESLSKQLEKIQQMDKKQLRVYFKEQSKKAKSRDQRGSGLGLIEMARKGQDMSFGFTEKDEAHSLFSIKVTI